MRRNMIAAGATAGTIGVTTEITNENNELNRIVEDTIAIAAADASTAVDLQMIGYYEPDMDLDGEMEFDEDGICCINMCDDCNCCEGDE